MQRFLAVLLVALAVPCAAAAAVPGAPSVIVYPFTPNGAAVDKEAPARLATLLATQIAADGRVAVKAPPPGTERKAFLDVARREGVEYYLSGFITPLGDSVTVVQQLVSTQSGIVVFAETATLATYNDAAGVGDRLRDAILIHAGRNLPVNAPSAPPAQPTPVASGNGASANIGGIFKGRKRPATTTAAATAAPGAPTNAPAASVRVVAATAVPATPRPPTPRPATAVPAATPAAVAAAPATGAIAVAPVTGEADAALRGEAAAAVVASLQAAHRTATRADAAATCSEGATEIAGGTLATVPDRQYGGTSATFDFVVRDCAGRVVYRRSETADAGGAESARVAVQRAVERAVGRYVHPPRKR